MAKKEIKSFPKVDHPEIEYRIIRAAASGVPIFGGAFQELLDVAIGSPLQKRREDWFNSVGEVLQDVCNRVEGLSPEALGENEVFLSVVANATAIAMRNHRTEKLEALKNIVANTAAGYSLDDVLLNTFLDLIDRLSPLHIVVLRINDNPANFPEIIAVGKSLMAGSFRHLIKAALPKCTDPVLNQVEADLTSAGLIDGGGNVMMSGGGLMNSHTTPRGKAFVKFISAN